MRLVTTLAVTLVLALLGAATATADVIDFAPPYSAGDIFGQDGWAKTSGTGTGSISTTEYAYFDGSLNARRDLNTAATSGTVTFSVDMKTDGDGAMLFYTGNDEFFTDAAPTGVTGIASGFGFSSLNIRYRNGDNWVDGATISTASWYIFAGTIDLATKTYDLTVTLQGSSTPLASYSNLGFRDATNCDAISRIGVYNAGVGLRSRYDNISVVVPEPTTIGLLAIGGLLAVRRRRK